MEAAGALFTIMGREEKTGWLARLKGIPGIEMERATDELLYLDFFAIYYSLKFTHAPGWKGKGLPVFERLATLMVDMIGDFWESRSVGTRQEASKLLASRIAYYGAITEGPEAEDPDSMLRAIGEKFAMYAITNDSHYRGDGFPREDRFLDALQRLRRYGEPAVAVGGEAFNERVKSLYGMFNSFSLV